MEGIDIQNGKESFLRKQTAMVGLDTRNGALRRMCDRTNTVIGNGNCAGTGDSGNASDFFRKISQRGAG
jgi:hypothetical protein